ncbi:hypothetical protein FNV43_RR21435 [Rhamnella rubrinervis]|uniref:3'-5' exonuclease domain-containing protein n=1 Tax=Rhamnella rubrinervis TaxID=2594499 RepID=A0A8K0GV27_9ROSA|nr:hypothetical protein FNV43_RR21435 [Rhamnella rubrinervis]
MGTTTEEDKESQSWGKNHGSTAPYLDVKASDSLRRGWKDGVDGRMRSMGEQRGLCKTIETTVTDKASITDQWVTQILARHEGRPTVVGLDIEWRPHQNSWMSNKSATLQLCIDDKCLIAQAGLKDLAFQIRGLNMKKPLHVTNSNWEARMLTDDQVEYACNDAYVSYRVGKEVVNV